MNFFEEIFNFVSDPMFGIALLALLGIEIFFAINRRRAPLLVLIGVPLLCANAAYNVLSEMGWHAQASASTAQIAAVVLGAAMMLFIGGFASERT